MPIPTRIELDQAIRSAAARLRVVNEDLRQGSVEMVRYQTRAGPMEEPWGMEGGFAVVYKFRMRSGRLRALRVFKRLVPDDMAARYRLLHPYLRRCLPGYTVECIYHEHAVLVKHQNGGQDVYPVLEMDWVEGETLLQYVDRCCRAGDRASLRLLASSWQALYGEMRAADIAHGDLSGGNVLVRPDKSLVLIDYDGVYTPELAPFQPIVGGQPDYQHPDASNRPFSPLMDGFSYLVIYTALLAVAAEPGLWSAHTQRGPGGNLLNENMLFRREDFEQPQHSSLMNELARSRDVEVREALTALREACAGPASAVSVPEALQGPTAELRRSLHRLVYAIYQGDSRAIVNCWTPALARLPQARVHLPQVRAARRRLEALQRLRLAIVLGNDLWIAASCSPSLERSLELTAAERQRLDLARRRNAALLRFHQALYSDDDRRIVAAYDAVLDGNPAVQPSERLRLSLARRRLECLHAFRVALYRDDDEAIERAYSPLLDDSPIVTAGERQRLALARARAAALRRFREALATGDDAEVVAAFDPVLEDCRAFDGDARARLLAARQRLRALLAFRHALISGDERRVLASYDAILDGHPSLLAFEWAIVMRARQRANVL